MSKLIPSLVRWNKEGNDIYIALKTDPSNYIPLVKLNSEYVCIINSPAEEPLYYRYIIDGIDQFDPDSPSKLLGTHMYNYITPIPSETITSLKAEYENALS